MAFMSGPQTLSNIADLVRESLRASWRMGEQIEDTAIQARWDRDDIVLDVRHRLVSRLDIDNNGLTALIALISRRMRAAMLVTEPAIPTAHDLRVERRRLHHRGHLARKAKPRLTKQKESVPCC